VDCHRFGFKNHSPRLLSGPQLQTPISCPLLLLRFPQQREKKKKRRAETETKIETKTKIAAAALAAVAAEGTEIGTEIETRTKIRISTKRKKKIRETTTRRGCFEVHFVGLGRLRKRF
jgi:hypothetical protein